MDGPRALIALVGLVTVGVVVYGCASPARELNGSVPEVKAVDTTVAFPNVLGMSGENAESAIEDLLPNSSAMTESGGEAYDYALANRCHWTGPDGKLSFNSSWPVVSVVLVIDPKMPAGTSPTEPVQPGNRYEKMDRLFFMLYTEKPADVWCKPYGNSGPAGGMPNVDLPNHSDGGEPWFCRRHRWC